MTILDKQNMPTTITEQKRAIGMYEWAVIILGASVLLSVAIIGILAFVGKEVPSVLEIVVGSALTGLVGMIAGGNTQ